MPEKKEDIKQIKKIQKDLHEQFISWVKLRRGKRLKGKDDELFNAGIWSGEEAKKLGLIDGLGDYYNIMKEKFGKDVKFRDFSKKTSWLKQRFFSSKQTEVEEIIDNVINLIEKKILWSRYGL